MSTENEIRTSPVVGFVNEIGVIFSDNDCQLKFSIQGDPRIVQSHIAMTHKTSKLLYKLLQHIMDNYEKDTGVEVPFDESKLESVLTEGQGPSDSSD